MKHTRRGLYKILERLKNRRKRFFENTNDDHKYDDADYIDITEDYIKYIVYNFAKDYGCSCKVNKVDLAEEKIDFTFTNCTFFERSLPGETTEVNVTIVLDPEKSNSTVITYICSFEIHKKCVESIDIEKLDVDYKKIGYVDKELKIPAPILYKYIADREYIFDIYDDEEDEYEEYNEEDDYNDEIVEDEVMFDYAIFAVLSDINEDEIAEEALEEVDYEARSIQETTQILGNDPAEEKNLWHFGDVRGLKYTRQDVLEDESILDEDKEKAILLKNMKTVNSILKDDSVNDKEKEKKMLNLTGMAIRKKK
jgi:hypothetical protein